MVCYDYLPDGTGIIVGLSFYAILTAYSLLHCPPVRGLFFTLNENTVKEKKQVL